MRVRALQLPGCLGCDRGGLPERDIMGKHWVLPGAAWMWFFPFVDVVYHIDCFEHIEPSLQPWNESN